MCLILKQAITPLCTQASDFTLIHPYVVKLATLPLCAH